MAQVIQVKAMAICGCRINGPYWKTADDKLKTIAKYSQIFRIELKYNGQSEEIDNVFDGSAVDGADGDGSRQFMMPLMNAPVHFAMVQHPSDAIVRKIIE